jgi:5-oxoprolinase (ATP-hydrolysing)
VRDVHFGGSKPLSTPVYMLADFKAGALVNGPALVIDELTTLVVEPACRAYVCEGGHITIAIESVQSKPALSPSASAAQSPSCPSDPVDPVLLSIFSHRFMSIAEQMGRTLQVTTCYLLSSVHCRVPLSRVAISLTTV